MTQVVDPVQLENEFANDAEMLPTPPKTATRTPKTENTAPSGAGGFLGGLLGINRIR